MEFAEKYPEDVPKGVREIWRERVKEKSVTNAVKRYLDTLETCWYFKVHGSLSQATGIPDIIGCYKGRFFWFELKRPGGKTTQLQERIIKHIIRAGGTLGAVVESAAEVKAVIEKEGPTNG